MTDVEWLEAAANLLAEQTRETLDVLRVMNQNAIANWQDKFNRKVIEALAVKIRRIEVIIMEDQVKIIMRTIVNVEDFDMIESTMLEDLTTSCNVMLKVVGQRLKKADERICKRIQEQDEKFQLQMQMETMSMSKRAYTIAYHNKERINGFKEQIINKRKLCESIIKCRQNDYDNFDQQEILIKEVEDM